MKAALFALLLAPIAAFAAYDCRLAVFAKDLPQGYLEFKYLTAPSDQPHGGPGYEFASDGHKVSVISDGRWLGITWFKHGILVASVITARGEDNPSAQALIVYNPEDPQEQATLDCSLQK